MISRAVERGKRSRGSIKVLNGNKAAAYGALLSRPSVISAYPITPQTPLVEYLSNFVAEGLLDATMVEVESEHSALSLLQGASLAGSRVFTGTSSQGLALMYEPYIRASTLRLPIVMCIATREVISPQSVWGGQQDAVTLRDAGWVQLFVEDNQEILDTVIMAYRIAEHKEVILPVNVCYDGFYLSHLTERVEIPTQEEVDDFLPPYRPEHLILDPERPMSVDPLTQGELLMEYRYKHCLALKRAKSAIEEVDGEFGAKFGRSYGGLIEKYLSDDAELLLVTMGSMTGTARVAIDRAREEGLKAGLIKIRALRPFPSEVLCEAIKGKAAVGVVERNVCFGWGSGALYMEIRSALAFEREKPAIVGFIDGLGGADITLDHFKRAIEIVSQAAVGKIERPITWLGIEV